jgi:hypothetical protein
MQITLAAGEHNPDEHEHAINCLRRSQLLAQQVLRKHGLKPLRDELVE